MGLDLVGWRGCELQTRLGPAGFLGKLKLRAYRRLLQDVFRQRGTPTEEQAGQQVNVTVTGRAPQVLTYGQICSELRDFDEGIPACKQCPMSGGDAVGCYRYITYPLDAESETRLFAFFATDVQRESSYSRAFYDEVVSGISAEVAEGWAQGIAELPEPLTTELDGEVITSRQVIASLVAIDHDDAGSLEFASAFLSDFVKVMLLDESDVLDMSFGGDEGTLEIGIDPYPALDAIGSRTVRELTAMSALYESTMDEGGTVLWDG